MPPLLNRRYRYRLFSSALWKQRIVFLGGAVVVGLVASGFALLCARSEHLFDRLLAISPYMPLLITPPGFMLCAFLSRRYFPGSQGAGIPHVVAARHTRDPDKRHQLVSLKIAAGKILLTPLALLIGASAGREGPTVQIGAAILLATGRFFGRGRQHGLILAGGAAGIAAAFNTPLAGIVFAIEELSRSFERRANSLVLTAIIFAGISAIAVMGNHTYFGTTNASIETRDWPALIVCGLAGGLCGGLFSRFLIAALNYKLPLGIAEKTRAHPYFFAGLCGLLVALIGVSSGNLIFGTGYEEARSMIEGHATIPWFYGILKMLATALSSISGIPGGFFAPSLSAGAGLGANIASLLPGSPTGAIVILGMAAYFSGIVQAPITSFVIVFEMTNNHRMVVPIMAASLIAAATSRLVCRKPIYHTLGETLLRQMSHPSRA